MDEHKLVQLVKEASRCGEDAVAWSWMYTGKSLLPKSYTLERLQLELQLADGSWAAAAASIGAMLELFPPLQHPEWAALLVEIVITAVQEAKVALDADVSAFTRVFRELSPDQRCKMTKHATTHAAAKQDCRLECQLHAFLLATFPDLVATEGERIVERALAISEEATSTEGVHAIVRAVVQSQHLQLSRVTVGSAATGDAGGSATFRKAKQWVMRTAHLCVKVHQWQSAFAVMLCLWQQCGMPALQATAIDLGKPSSSPDAKMLEELSRVSGLVEGGPNGGPLKQLADALKALYFYKVCSQYMSCAVVRGGRSTTGSSGTLAEDAAIQQEAEDAPVITVVHCPPYTSKTASSISTLNRNAAEAAAIEATICRCVGAFCKCSDEGGGGSNKRKRERHRGADLSASAGGADTQRARTGDAPEDGGGGAADFTSEVGTIVVSAASPHVPPSALAAPAARGASADAFFVEDASHGRVVAAQSLLAAATGVWQLVCGQRPGGGTSNTIGGSKRLPQSVANFFTGTTGGGSGSGGISLGGSSSSSRTTPMFDPLWLAVLSTDVALSRRSYAEAQRYASDVVSLCERFPHGMVGGGGGGGASAGGGRSIDCGGLGKSGGNSNGGARSPLVVGVTERAIATIKLRGMLQRMSALVALGNLEHARMLALKILTALPADAPSVRAMLCNGLPERVKPTLQHSMGSGSGGGGSGGSDLKLLPCLPPHIVSCTFELLLPSYEADAAASGLADAHVARLLTVYQHEWPRYQSGFDALLEWIGSQDRFKFERFFQHIGNVDYAEEF
eukprot:gene16807-954_t